jgi:alpha-1,4-galacturonosyltransferase
VVVLDDDVVVQRDLSFLWNIDMGDKVNGAVEFCGLKLGEMKNVLGKTTYDPKSCAWMHCFKCPAKALSGELLDKL